MLFFTHKTVKGTLAGLAAVLLFSTTALIVTLARDVNAYLYISFGSFVAVSVFFLKWIVQWKLQKKNPLKILRSVPIWFYAIALLGTGVHDVTWILAIQEAPPEEATLIIYQWPILLVLFSAVTLKKRLKISQILACFIGMAGIYVLLTEKGVSLSSFHFESGHVYAAISAVSWAIFSAVAAKFEDMPSDFFVPAFLISGIVTGLIWIFVYDAVPARPESLFIVGSFAVFIAGAYILWDFAMKQGDTQMIAFAGLLIPVLATVLLVIAGFAEWSLSLVVALILVMAAILIAKFNTKLFGFLLDAK